MELKDVILSTLAEMEEIKPEINHHRSADEFKLMIKQEVKQEIKQQEPEPAVAAEEEQVICNEMLFLTSIRERLLVLFEGFQAPNNANIEAKVDMTLNFLEYVLVTIDSRVEELERGSCK